MHLGVNLWKTLPKRASGLRPALRESPWALSATLGSQLQTALGASTPQNMALALVDKISYGDGPSIAVGLVDSRLYLGPALRLADGHGHTLTPFQVLLANLVAHGESRLDAVAASDLPCRLSKDLLRELADFETVAWLSREPGLLVGDAGGFSLPSRGGCTMPDIVGREHG